MNKPDQELFAAAEVLVKGAGLPKPHQFVLLVGGKNNRVYRVDLADGGNLVLKSYFHDPRDTRDRLGAEWAFTTYAWERGVRSLPRPLALDRERHIGLYSFLRGRKLISGEVQAAHVDASVDFVLAVNRPPRDTASLSPASEACFSLSDHIATVERRVTALGSIAPDVPLHDDAVRFVAERLVPSWHAVRDRLVDRAQQLGLPLDQPLSEDEQIVSPSDFGFHNALVVNNEVQFIDFEYAGRDDPAKFVCDFFCQPEVPVPLEHFDHAIDRLVSGLNFAESQRQRCAALLELYRIKWACIMLNPFLPVGAARRAFADATSWQDQCAAQLSKATRALSTIEISL